MDETRQQVFRAIVGKAQWILRARPDVLHAIKELSRRLQGPREVDDVAAKRMVKYLYGTRDTALQPRPRKEPLRLDMLAMVWLSGALVSSFCKSLPRRHQKRSTTHAQWELDRQSLFNPFLNGV